MPTVIDPVCVVGGMENINRNITVTGEPPPTFVILENLYTIIILVCAGKVINYFYSSLYCV